MSADAATDATVPAKGGKKKLIIIIAVVVLVLLLGGGGAVFYLMQKQAAAQAAALNGDEEEAHGSDSHGAAAKPARPEHPPTFVPLDPFVANLADKDADRFAQIGVNLQVQDSAAEAEIKSYMPAIRNAVLLTLAHKTSQDLLSPEGKEKLATELKWAATAAMGYEVPDPEEAASEDEAASDEEADVPKKKKKKKKKPDEPYSPIEKVNYASFVVQ
jgi:flagellar protein FliL